MGSPERAACSSWALDGRFGCTLLLLLCLKPAPDRTQLKIGAGFGACREELDINQKFVIRDNDHFTAIAYLTTNPLMESLNTAHSAAQGFDIDPKPFGVDSNRLRTAAARLNGSTRFTADGAFPAQPTSPRTARRRCMITSMCSGSGG